MLVIIQVLRDSPSKNFFPSSRDTQESEGFFLFLRATYTGTCVEAFESAKEGEEVAPAKARFRVPYTKNFFFGSRVFGF